jgi:TATA-binding protein-associated factor Taf7
MTTTEQDERLDPNSDRAKRIAENLADVFADVEHAIAQRRRQTERHTGAA